MKKKLPILVVEGFVAICVIVGLFSAVDTVSSMSETWNKFSDFVTEHAEFLSQGQARFLGGVLLVIGGIAAGFELSRMKKDRKPSKPLIATAAVCLGFGIVMVGFVALGPLLPSKEPKKIAKVPPSKHHHHHGGGSRAFAESGGESGEARGGGGAEGNGAVGSEAEGGSSGAQSSRAKGSGACVCTPIVPSGGGGSGGSGSEEVTPEPAPEPVEPEPEPVEPEPEPIEPEPEPVGSEAEAEEFEAEEFSLE